MRTRLARLLLAAARRLDPHVGRILHPQARVAWGDPVPRSRDEVDKAVASMEYARQRYGFASGGRILPADTFCDCQYDHGRRILGSRCNTHTHADSIGPFKLSEGGPVCKLCGGVGQPEPIEVTRGPSYPVEYVPGPWKCPEGHRI